MATWFAVMARRRYLPQRYLLHHSGGGGSRLILRRRPLQFLPPRSANGAMRRKRYEAVLLVYWENQVCGRGTTCGTLRVLALLANG